MKVKFTKLAALLLAGVALFATGCTDYEVDIQKVDKKVDNLTTEVNNKIASLEQQIAGLNATIATLETKADHDKDIAALNKTISELETALRAALDTKVDKDVYNAKMAEIAGKIQNLEAADENFKNQIQDIVTELAKKVNQTDFDEAVANLTSAINGEIARATAAEADLKATIDDINKVQLPALRQRVKDIEDELPTIRQNIVDLQNGKLDKAEFDDYYKAAYEKYTKATIEAMKGAIGDLAKLKTTEKTSLVDALNEVFDKFGDYVLKTELTEILKLYVTQEELTIVKNALQGQIDGLKALIGEFPEGTTVRKYIDDKVDGLQIQINRIVDELIPALDGRVADLEDKVNNTILPQIQFAIGYESKYAGHVEGYDFANGLQGYIQDMAMDTFIAACQYADQEVAKVREELNAFKAQMYDLLHQLASRIQSIVYVPDYDDLKITSNMAVVTQKGVEEAMYMDQPTEVTYKILPAKYAAAVADNYKDLLVFDVKTVKTRADEEADVEPAFQIMSVKKDANIDENGLVTFTVLPVNVASAQFAATDIPVEFNAVFGGLVNVWGFDVPMLFPDFERVYPVVNAADLEAYMARAAFAASLRFVCQDVDIPTDPASEEYNEVASTYNVLFPAVSQSFEIGVYKPEEDEEGNTKLVAVGEEWQKLPYTSLREATAEYAAGVGEPKNQDPKGYRIIQDGAIPGIVIGDQDPMTLEEAAAAGYVVPDAKITFKDFTYFVNKDAFDQGQEAAEGDVKTDLFIETPKDAYAEFEMNPEKKPMERKEALGNVASGNYQMTTAFGVTEFDGQVEIVKPQGEVAADATIVWTWALDAVVDHNLFYPNEVDADNDATTYTRVKYPIHLDEDDVKYIFDNLPLNPDFSDFDGVNAKLTVTMPDPDDPTADPIDVTDQFVITHDQIVDGGLVVDFEFPQELWGKEFKVTAVYEIDLADITINGVVKTIDRFRDPVQIKLDPKTFVVNGEDYYDGYYHWESEPQHAAIFKAFVDSLVINLPENVAGDFKYDDEQEDFNESELEGFLRMAANSGSAKGYIDFNRDEIVLKSLSTLTPEVLASEIFSTCERDANDPNLWIGKQVTRNVTTYIGEEVEVVMQFNYKVPDYNFLHLSYYTFNTDKDKEVTEDNFIQYYKLDDWLFEPQVKTPYDAPLWWTQVQPSYFNAQKTENTTEAQAQAMVSNRYALADYDVKYINLAELAFNIVDEKDDILEPADMEEIGLKVFFEYKDSTKLTTKLDDNGYLELPDPDMKIGNPEFLLYKSLWVDNTTFYYLTNEHPWIPARGVMTLTVGTVGQGGYEFPVATRFDFEKNSVKHEGVELDYSNYAMVRWTPFKTGTADGFTIVLDENKIYAEPLFKGMNLMDRRPNNTSFNVIQDGKWVVGNAPADATAASKKNGYLNTITSKEAYHIEEDFDFNEVVLPAELRKIMKIMYSADGVTFVEKESATPDMVPYIYFDYTSEVEFRGEVVLNVVVKLDNPWQEQLVFNYDITIKGVR